MTNAPFRFSGEAEEDLTERMAFCFLISLPSSWAFDSPNQVLGKPKPWPCIFHQNMLVESGRGRGSEKSFQVAKWRVISAVVKLTLKCSWKSWAKPWARRLSLCILSLGHHWQRCCRGATVGTRGSGGRYRGVSHFLFNIKCAFYLGILNLTIRLWKP